MTHLITFKRDWFAPSGHFYRWRDGAQPLIGGEGLADLPSDALINDVPKHEFLSRPKENVEKRKPLNQPVDKKG